MAGPPSCRQTRHSSGGTTLVAGGAGKDAVAQVGGDGYVDHGGRGELERCLDGGKVVGGAAGTGAQIQFRQLALNAIAARKASAAKEVAPPRRATRRRLLPAAPSGTTCCAERWCRCGDGCGSRHTVAAAAAPPSEAVLAAAGADLPPGRA